MALNPELDTILLAEVKWKKNLVGIDVLDKLKEKAKKVVWGTPKRKEILALFSKSGFTDAVMESATGGSMLLFKQGSYLAGKIG